MPRPKRSRVAPSRAAAIEKQQSSATPPIVTQPALSEAPSSDTLDASDGEKRRRKTRASSAQQARTLEVNSEQAEALEDARAKLGEAMDKLDNITSASNPAEDSESPNIEHSRRESVSVAAGSRPARLTDASGLDLDDDMLFNLDDSLDDSAVVDDTQSGHYSRATDTSSFNVAAFRRRPRQSSIVGKDDAPIRPSSRGQNTPSITSHLNLGRFKRRQREPSILGTNRKESAQRPQSQMSTYGSVMGDDDSGPEDQSTPLDKTKRHSGAVREAQGSREGSPTLPTRKRKSLEDQAGPEKRQALGFTSTRGSSSGPDLPLRGEANPNLPAFPPGVVHQSIEVDSTPPGSPSRHTPDPNDPDMAPPASSSSSMATSPVLLPSLDILAHRTYHRKQARARTPELDDAPSDLSSPPSLTHSPNYGTTRTRAKAKAKPVKTKSPPKAVTANLENLLPARRKRKPAAPPTETTEDPFDVESSEDDHLDGTVDEEGDMSYRQRGSKKAGPKKRQAALAQAKAKNAKAAEAEKEKRRLKRYGQFNESDKENDEAEEEEGEEAEGGEGVTVELGSEAGDQAGDESVWDAEKSALMEAKMGSELKNAAKKFKEVDRWELSFEEIDEPSSPVPGAR
ncbi:hypothetical protein OQA88_128 [Cercophora sp. LCS_1]